MQENHLQLIKVKIISLLLLSPIAFYTGLKIANSKATLPLKTSKTPISGNHFGIYSLIEMDQPILDWLSYRNF